ncbi:MAG TPA: hypothetical protein VFD01_20225 [Candidatus Dormibacteraeota bacterium]|nr:hypothetical protein [Candidatus Dormibacteraeota bacterium]
MLAGALRAVAGALVAAYLVPAAGTGDGPARWTGRVHLPGVVDVGGPRSDGRVVVSGGSRLYLLDRSTDTLTPFADGPGGYTGGGGDEPYLAVSPGGQVPGAGCEFAPDDVYVLRPNAAEVVRVGADGRAHRFAHLSGVRSLNGIAFDTAGRFGRRLLVSGPGRNGNLVVAIDCHGRAVTVTTTAPAMEGGMAVAPSGFGAFAGDLVAPDELSGRVLAVRPDGSTAVVVDSGLPTGQDVGVEGLGFVPSGFGRGGVALFADRSTPGNPHPGTGSLLALDARSLVEAGVREGDLLVATEGGARTIVVRCAPDCRAAPVAAGPAVAHGEGHLLLVADHPGPPPPALPAAADLGRGSGPSPATLTAGVAAGLLSAALLAALVLLGLGWVRRRRRSS